MRREFTKETRRDALERAEMLCEGLLSSGERCCANLKHKPFHFDHIVPAAIGGDNALQNCQVLCVPCHKSKTGGRDIKIIRKAVRGNDKYRGIRKRSRFPGSRDSKFKRKVSGDVVLR